jgi:integrase
VESLRWREGTLAARYRAFGELCQDVASWHPSLGISIHNITPELLIGWLEGQYLPRHQGGARTRLADGRVVCSPSAVSSCLSHLSTAFGQLDPPRSGEYDGQTGAGNPTQCALVRNYRAGYLQWAKGGGFEAQAAVPLSETKVHQLVLALRQAYDEACSTDPSISVALLLRDSVYFLYLWESWQRGAEAGAIRADRVRFTDAGMEVEIGDTKANRSGFSGLLRFQRHRGDPRLCVVSGVQRLLAVTAAHHPGGPSDPSHASGYVFRTLTPCRSYFSDGAFSGDAAYQRLLGHLQRYGLYDGESLHSFRRGANQHALASGVPISERQARGLWASPATVRRYDRPSGKLPLSKRARCSLPSSAVGGPVAN